MLVMGRRCILFLFDFLPLPSSLIMYDWSPSFPITLPLLFHFPFSLPAPCCTSTSCPSFKFCSLFVCSAHLLPSLLSFSAYALSLSPASMCHLLSSAHVPSASCIRSLMCLPNSRLAGDLFRSLSGVFLYSIRAILALSPVSPSPLVQASLKILFMLFTPVSALMLACGL